MRKFIVCLLLGTLLGVIPSLLPAQQNENPQKSDTEFEVLEKRVSELEKQLQTVENVEKMELQAKLADANAKLFNAEFGKFERGLKDSSDEWLRGWSSWFLGVIGVFVAIFIGVGAVFWSWLKSRTNQLIADTVEKNLNDFKEAVSEQDVIKNQLRGLEEAYGASILLENVNYFLGEEHLHPEQIKALREETLLQLFSDERYYPELRYKAAEVLAARKSPRLVSPLLELLNSVVDLDSDIDFETESHLHSYVNFLSHIHTPETYQGLRKLLNRLLTEDPKCKDLFLTEIVYSLAWVSIKLNIGDSVSILKMAIPYLQIRQQEQQAIKNLARYFDIFNESAGIKEILINHVTSESSGMEEVEEKCLELLQKHDPAFVNEWRARKTTNNSNA